MGPWLTPCTCILLGSGAAGTATALGHPQGSFPQQCKLKEETFLYITLKKLTATWKDGISKEYVHKRVLQVGKKSLLWLWHGICHVYTLGKNPGVQTAPKDHILGNSEPLKCCCFTPKLSRDKGGRLWAKSSWNSLHKTLEIKHWKSKLVGFWAWNLWPTSSSWSPNSCKPWKNKSDVTSALYFSAETKEKVGKEEDL